MEKAVHLNPLRSHSVSVNGEQATAGRVKFAKVLRLDLLVSSVIQTLLNWQERASQRHHLAQLNDRFLKDMGISAAERAAEVRKPFWKA